MKNLTFILLCGMVLFSQWAYAQSPVQNIEEVQFYFNTEPGVGQTGNGVILPLTPDSTIDQTFDLSLPGTLPRGLNFLYARVKSDSGTWSLPERRAFYVADLPADMVIQKAEYFFDAEPGVGQGTAIAMGPAAVIDQTLSIPLDPGLGAGIHFLYLRVQNQQGDWSLIERRAFFIADMPTDVVIQQAEYFFDTEPGIGQGSPIALGPAASIDQTLILPLDNNLNAGIHFLYLRVQDQHGNWSLHERRAFFIADMPTDVVIAQAEYFIDSEPGVGQGINLPLTSAASIEQTFQIPLDPNISPGLHFLYLRFKDQNDNWSLIERRPFFIQEITDEVVALEYYYDVDPGFGLANALTVSPASTIDQVFDIGVPCLSEGQHLLYIRGQDEHGRWSLFAYDTLTIDSSDVEPTVITPAGPVTVCPNEGVVLSFDSIPGVSYHWTLNGDTIAGAYGATYTALLPGDYGVLSTCDTISVAAIPVTINHLALVTYYADTDGDGYGDNLVDTMDCSPPSGYVANNLDCNDNDAGINPGILETCNGIDDNCDGLIDEGVKTTYFADNDGDGYGDANSDTLDCSLPSGYVANNLDCNDNDAGIYPGATEVCNDVDDNCDGQIDENVKNTYYADTDNDGYGDASNFILACSLPSGYVTDDTDCDDVDASVFPGATEVCNGTDDNCDGLIDEGYIYSLAPGSIISDLGSDICLGQSVVLSVSGGQLGTAADWIWYEGSCGLSLLGSGSTISLTPTTGTHNIYVRAEGSCNTTNCVSFTLQVNTQPDITTCSLDQFVGTMNGLCQATAGYNLVVYGSPLPDITYSFDGATIDSGTGSGTGSTFNVGETTVTIIAENSCGSDTCSFTITVNDTEDPVLSSCPSSTTVEVEEGMWGANIGWTPPSATDNCGIDQLISDHEPDDFFNVGTTSVVYTATDIHGNTTTCGFDITVNEPDVIGDANLSIFADDIEISNYTPDTSDIITVNAVIHNTSGRDAGSFTTRLISQYDSTIYGDTVVPGLLAGQSATLVWEITTPSIPAFVPIQVVVDLTDSIVESNELDNQAIRPFINGAFSLNAGIVVSVAPATASVTAGQTIQLCGDARYDSTAVPLDDYSVAGADVTLTIVETGQLLYGSTDATGHFCIPYVTPLTPGTMSYTAEVTDFTLIGQSDTANFEVTPIIVTCPLDLELVQLELSGSFICGSNLEKFYMPAGQSMGAEVLLRNGCSSINDSTVLYAYSPGGTPTYQEIVIPPLEPGELHTATIPDMTFHSAGTFYFIVIADYEDVLDEASEGNNSAQRLLHVLPLTSDIIPTTISGSGTEACLVDKVEIGLINSGGSDTGPFDTYVEIIDDTTTVHAGMHAISNIPANCGEVIDIAIGISPDTDYKVRVTVDSNDVVTESSEVNNYKEAVLNFPPCRPDLWIHDCAAFDVKPGDPTYPGVITVSTTIGNAGGSAAEGPFEIELQVGASSYTMTVNDTIGVDEAQSYSIDIPTPAPATEDLVVIVDALGQIDETVEFNNTHGKPLCWNFELTNIRCDQSTAIPGTQQLCHPADIGIAVFNHGLYEAVNFTLKFEIEGPGLPAGWNSLGELTYYMGNTCVCPWYKQLDTTFYYPQAGNYQIRITADPANSYTECDETNNQIVVGVNVKDAADYSTFSEYIAPSKLNPEVNESITFVGSYQNDGCTGLDSMELLIAMNEVALDSVRAQPLDSGHFFSYAFPTSWSSGLAGLHIARLYVDHDDELAEIDETNNEATRAIIVGKSPDMNVYSLIPSAWNPSLGDNLQITAKITNEGDVTATSEIDFYMISTSGSKTQIGQKAFQLAGFDSTTVVMDWPTSDRFALIEAVISGTSPEEYDLSDNTRNFRLNGLAVTTQSQDILCATLDTGTVEVIISGGRPPYVIEWSNGLSDNKLTVEAGNYEVSVTDAAGVMASATASVSIHNYPVMWYLDSDDDGYGSLLDSVLDCDTLAGYVLISGDCNDLDTLVNPGAQEVCNGIDDDCDGLIDDNDPSVIGQITWYLDGDADNYGHPDSTKVQCSQPVGYVGNGTDCDDADNTVYPGAVEVADGKDNDCDGQIDEGVNVLEVSLEECFIIYLGYPDRECVELVPALSGGTAPFTYLWHTGETTDSITVCPDSSIIAEVTVTDSLGQTATGQVTLQVIDIRCGKNNNKVVICHYPPGKPNNPQTICVGVSSVADHLSHGDVLGTCGAEDPCGDTTYTFRRHIGQPGSKYVSSDLVTPSADAFAVSVYPIPTTDEIQLHSLEKIESIKLFDAKGQWLKSWPGSIGSTFHIGDLPPGVYFLRLRASSGKVTVKKAVLIER